MLRCSFWCRSRTTNAAESYNVVVSGAGLVGTAMMASLQQLRSRLATTSTAGLQHGPAVSSTALSRLLMVEAGKKSTYQPNRLLDSLRTVSITPVSSKILDNLGGWSRLQTKHPYYRLAVRHEQVNGPSLAPGSRSSTFFLSSLLGSRSSTEPLLEFTDLRRPVGFLCLNAELNTALLSVVEDGCGSGDTLRFNTGLRDLRLPPPETLDGPWGTATMTAGQDASTVDFELMLGCEGRNSPLQGVIATPSLQQDYAQTAFVCTARLEKLADGNVCCFQNFFRDGRIIAMLPTSDETANIVFSTTAQHVKELESSTQADLVSELNRRLYSFAPNDIPRIIEIAEEATPEGGVQRAQGSFPLKLQIATMPYGPRAILLGDAAHGIHPFAGQGLNLGIYDVCALTAALESAIRGGQDIGSSLAVGQVFAADMLRHTAPMIGGMEVIKKLTYGLPGLSSLGMKALNSVPFLSTLSKDAIMQVSSGALFASEHKDCFLLQ